MDGREDIFYSTTILKKRQRAPGKDDADFLLTVVIRFYHEGESLKEEVTPDGVNREAWLQVSQRAFPVLGSQDYPIRAIYSRQGEHNRNIFDVHICRSGCYLQLHSDTLSLTLADIEEIVALANDAIKRI